jgi:hypothetical protein
VRVARPPQCHDALRRLASLGLLLPHGGDEDLYRLVPVVAEVALRRWPLPAEEAAKLHTIGANWYDERGLAAPALRAHLAAGDNVACARLLTSHGADLLIGGHAETVVAAFEALPEQMRSAVLRLRYGEALLIRGDADKALAVYATATGRRKRLEPALAWRYGVVHYLRGELHLALDVLARGRLGALRSTDEALLLGWTAAAHWKVDDAASCRTSARRALAAANATGNASALAVAMLRWPWTPSSAVIAPPLTSTTPRRCGPPRR